MGGTPGCQGSGCRWLGGWCFDRPSTLRQAQCSGCSSATYPRRVVFFIEIVLKDLSDRGCGRGMGGIPCCPDSVLGWRGG